MSINILLTSGSEIKRQAVAICFGAFQFDNLSITPFDCKDCGLPLQPLVRIVEGTQKELDNGFYFAKARMNYARQHNNFDDYDYVISIESCMVEEKRKLSDQCYVLIHNKGMLASGTPMMTRIGVPTNYSDILKRCDLVQYNEKMCGYGKTIGEIIHEANSEISSTNWMKAIHLIDRKDQIVSALNACLKNLIKVSDNKKKLMSAYKTYQDFPTKGVVFQDIFPLFKDSKMLKLMVKFIVNQYQFETIDYVVGLESRGLCIAILIAYALGVGFVPVRKGGKLPGKVINCSYGKEYGKDVCEMQVDDDLAGKRILAIDDLVGTGGSMMAAIGLLKTLNCVIVDCCVLRDVVALKETCVKTMSGNNYSVLLQ